MYTDWEREKTIFVHGWYNHLCRKSERTNQKQNKQTNEQNPSWSYNYSKMAGCEFLCKSQLFSYLPTWNKQNLKFKKNSKLALKHEIFRHKFNKICARLTWKLQKLLLAIKTDKCRWNTISCSWKKKSQYFQTMIGNLFL